jgi:hypothetical protein
LEKKKIILRLQKITSQRVHHMQAPSRNYLKAFNQSANSSHPRDVAEVVVKVVNTSNPNVRCPVGKDAESVLKKRAELSDMEMEKWVRESFLEKKGFIR